MCTGCRKNIWETMLVKIFCWRSYVSNLSIFKKITSVLHHYHRKTANSSHGKVCCRENQETSQWLLSWTFGGWFNYQMKSNFRYTKISRRRGLTAQYLEFANYSCTSIAIYDFSFEVILKSRLLSQTAAEHFFKVEDK